MEQKNILEIKNLSVGYPHRQSTVLQDINLELREGEILGLIGESGSGKSTLLQGILQLPGRVEITAGRVLFRGEDLQKLSSRQWQSLRGKHLGVVFQEPGASLDPIRKIHKQFFDTLHAHDRTVTRADARQKACEMLECMDFSDPERILESCPAQLSGGMNQRVAIALAMVLKPEVLLVDEPTSALDVTTQLQVVSELMRLRSAFGTSILLITHNMGVAAKMADRIAVMQEGRIVECGPTDALLRAPTHVYTRSLLAAVPQLGESFSVPHSDTAPILEMNHISKTFRAPGRGPVWALEDVSIVAHEGECVGIVGESGSGKSTLAQIMTSLLLPNSGSVTLGDRNLTTAKGADLRDTYRDVKMIFQEPRSSFDPRLTLGESLCEALKPVLPERAQRWKEAERLLERVGLDGGFLKRYPSQVSGGECQRAAIARALAQKPRLLICDEATSALDVSVQAQVIDLLNDIRRETGLAILFISHDIALVSNLCERIYVMRDGKIVEQGTTAELIQRPKQPYTQELVDSVLSTFPR